MDRLIILNQRKNYIYNISISMLVYIYSLDIMYIIILYTTCSHISHDNLICRMFITVSNLSYHCFVDETRFLFEHFDEVYSDTIDTAYSRLIQIGNCERDILIYPCLIFADIHRSFPLS